MSFFARDSSICCDARLVALKVSEETQAYLSGAKTAVQDGSILLSLGQSTLQVLDFFAISLYQSIGVNHFFFEGIQLSSWLSEIL